MCFDSIYKKSGDSSGDYQAEDGSECTPLHTVGSYGSRAAVHSGNDAQGGYNEIEHEDKFETYFSFGQKITQQKGRQGEADKDTRGTQTASKLEVDTGSGKNESRERSKKRREKQDSRNPEAQLIDGLAERLQFLFKSVRRHEAETQLESHVDCQQHRGIEHQVGLREPVGNLRLALRCGRIGGKQDEKGGDKSDHAHSYIAMEAELQHEAQAHHGEYYGYYYFHWSSFFLRRRRTRTTRPATAASTTTATIMPLTRFVTVSVVLSSSRFITMPSLSLPEMFSART